jgi:succinate dehydrogenase/fumarate reductase flavoprotein subunit/uncharacterized protein with FMN-binding domain
METLFNRRSFIAAAGVAAAAGAASLVSTEGAEGARADEAATTGCTYPESISWNANYDVVVVGFGGAGATASRFAADAGAKVLLVDSAPEGHEGGNTRYCAQLIASADDADSMLEYYRNLAWKMDMDEEVLKVYTQGEADMKRYVSEYLDCEPVAWKDNDTAPDYLAKALKAAIPEYPNLAGSETFDFLTVHEGIFDARLWRTLRDEVAKRTDNITVWLGSPAVGLVQDPDTRTVVGVRVQHDGEEALVRANNGVVLACGGFENNQQMVQDYLGAPRLAPLGSLYNTGDGVHMASEVGADLWHMHNYEALGMLGGNAIHVNEADGRARLTYWTTIANGSIIVIGDDGGRYMKEDDTERHGHFYSNGVWRIPTPQYSPHLLFDQTKYDWFEQNFDSLPNKEFLSGVVEGDTLEELAEKIGADPDILRQTVDHWNAMCDAGVDYERGRSADTMSAFDDGPYYAAELRPNVLNTQGGPRRNAKAEVVDRNGQPIPHLYSAGELGGVTAFQYQGGGNMAEDLIFGKIAGENAAAEKDELPVVERLVAAQDDLKDYSSYDFASEYVSPQLGDGQYLGTSEHGIGGVIQVVVTVKDGKVSDCEVVREAETDMYGEPALSVLASEAVEAGSADIDGVSGATCTSNAFKEAVQDALDQVK